MQSPTFVPHRRALRPPRALVLGLGLLLASSRVFAQETLNWSASAHFRFAIHDATTAVNAAGKLAVTVQFSVTDPTRGDAPWDILAAPEFKQPAGLSRLAVDVGWTTEDYQNTGAVGETLAPVPFKVVGGVASGGGAGIAPALPVSVDALKAATRVGPAHPGWYQVTAVLPPQAIGSGVVALEGHPAWARTAADGSTVWDRVPVTSVHRFLALGGGTPVSRRQVVALANCERCHDGGVHGDVEVPRLSLHGGNRTENLDVCVICHNPNQTDIGYRTAGEETPVDFKHMVHAIHAGKRRHDPFVVIGFRGSTNDFSGVRFPGEVSNCLLCHVESGGRSTFELPIARTVLGSTRISGSVPGSFVDIDPSNDRKMTPTVSVCSACHDGNEALAHMQSRRQGGSFIALPADIASGRVTERCAECHGPGKKEDLRHVHEVRAPRAGGSSGSGGSVGSGGSGGEEHEEDEEDEGGSRPRPRRDHD